MTEHTLLSKWYLFLAILLLSASCPRTLRHADWRSQEIEHLSLQLADDQLPKNKKTKQKKKRVQIKDITPHQKMIFPSKNHIYKQQKPDWWVLNPQTLNHISSV